MINPYSPLAGFRGVGLATSHLLDNGEPKYGTIEKCPHCPAENIVRLSVDQVTCRSGRCVDAQRKVTKGRSLRRLAARAERVAAAETERVAAAARAAVRTEWVAATERVK